MLLIGGICIGDSLLGNRSKEEANLGYFGGATYIIAGVVCLIQSNRLKSAVYKNKSAPSGGTIAWPIITPDYLGIRVSKSF